MWKKILLGVVTVVGIFAIVVALQPGEYKVTRTATIDAAPAVVFTHLNDFHKWEAWSPWAKLDPNAKNSFEGPESGKGSIFTWAGNGEIGEGRMEILESKPGETVKIKLEFFKPMADVCDTDFALKTEGNQTVVTWTMAGKKDYVSKAVCMFMNMDKMIGDDFEKGLASIKTIVETEKK